MIFKFFRHLFAFSSRQDARSDIAFASKLQKYARNILESHRQLNPLFRLIGRAMLFPFLDLIFPPLCLSCKERCSTKFLCPDCWHLCALPDPVERCRRCFEMLESGGNICSTCKKEKSLPFQRAYVFDPESPSRFLGFDAPEAMAGFALLQWIQLDWPMPHAIVPMPDRDSLAVAKAFAAFLDIPFIKALSHRFELREDYLEEESVLLLINGSNSTIDLQNGVLALTNSFPKRIYALTLHPC